jgi:peroxiredoxin
MAVESEMVPLGTTAPDFALPSVDGGSFALHDFDDSPALLVAFLCNHCPYVRHIETELGSVLAGIPELAVVAISSNDVDSYPDDAPPRLVEQAARAGWRFPYLVDTEQTAARSYGAACTPDFFLFDRDRRLAYRGAFDYASPGNDRPVTGELLSRAVSLVLAGEPVPEPHRPSLGCSLKWKPGNEPSAA